MKFLLRVSVLGALAGCSTLYAQSGYPVHQSAHADQARSSSPQEQEGAQTVEQANVPGSPYIEREFRLPVPGSGSKGLDVLEVYYNAPGKHPLALLTHGTSNVASEKAELTPWMYLSQAVWFAERGYVALVIIRRGYGSSGGEQDGVHGGCRPGGDFEQTGEASADDLRNAAAYAQKQLPEVGRLAHRKRRCFDGRFCASGAYGQSPAGVESCNQLCGRAWRRR